MKPRKQKHPNYKAYFAHQMRILQERFPFLSSRQIKAKVLASWERFTPEKKNGWGSPPTGKIKNGNSQNSNGTKARTSCRSPPSCHHQHISPPPNKSTAKKVQFSKPVANVLVIPKSPEHSTENSENSESSLVDLDMWPISDEFNSIAEHQLVVEEEEESVESESSKDEEMPSQERTVWPALFGDTTSIWKAVKNKESNEEKEQPMCSLFQETERKHFSKRRILTGLNPAEVKASTDIFEGNNDDDIFG